MLPTSTSLDKMMEFTPEAQKKGAVMFELILEKANELDSPECAGMLAIVKSRVELAIQRQTQVGEIWRGKTTQSVEEIEEHATVRRQREEAEKRIDKMVAELADNGVKTVKVDIAIGPNSEILVAYGMEGNKEIDPNAQEKLANLLNDCLFAESVLVTQDSTIYQAITLDRLVQDAQGQLVPGEREQIEKAFEKMDQSLESRGITLALKDDYKYEEVAAAATSEVERTSEEEPSAHPGEAPAKPEMG